MFQKTVIFLALAFAIIGCQNSATKASPEQEQVKRKVAAGGDMVPTGAKQVEGGSPPPEIAVCGENPILEPNVPGSPGNLIASAINPNGQSELAHTMRLMQKELVNNRDLLEKGQPGALLSIDAHGKIRCTWPTVESMRKGAYDPMARQYLKEIVRYNNSDRGGVDHNRVVDACITCHQQTCDGPTMAIDAARFKGSPEGIGGE